MLKMYNASRLIKILNVQEMSFIVRLVAVAIYKLKVGINRRVAATVHKRQRHAAGYCSVRETKRRLLRIREQTDNLDLVVVHPISLFTVLLHLIFGAYSLEDPRDPPVSSRRKQKVMSG